MTNAELEQMIQSIMERDDQKYTTPSGALLGLLSKLASELKLSVFADACDIYTALYPETTSFIAGRVPGILCNRYFTVHPDVDYDKFIQWSISTPSWGEPLKEKFSSSKGLEECVNNIRLAVGNYA